MYQFNICPLTRRQSKQRTCCKHILQCLRTRNPIAAKPAGHNKIYLIEFDSKPNSEEVSIVQIKQYRLKREKKKGRTPHNKQNTDPSAEGGRDLIPLKARGALPLLIENSCAHSIVFAARKLIRRYKHAFL